MNNDTIKPLQISNFENPNFDANRLLDALIEHYNLKNDAALSRMLALPPAIISKLRHQRTELSSTLILRIHDVTGWMPNEIRRLAGIEIPDFGIAANTEFNRKAA
jgi:hypothetical protein